MKVSKSPRNVKQASFTLFETVVALGIMATMMVELAGVQGNTIYFSEFAQRSTQATWLAKKVMSQVEYNWIHRDFSDIKEVEVSEVSFEDAPEFKYSLTIKNWKLPIAQMITNGGSMSEEEKKDAEKPADGQEDMIGQMIKQFLGDELLKVANVKVSWAEGARTNDVTLTYLLTNQRKIDETIATFEQTSKDINKPSSGGNQNQNSGSQGPNRSPNDDDDFSDKPTSSEGT